MPKSLQILAHTSQPEPLVIRNRLSWLWTIGPALIVLALGSLLSSYAFETWRTFETQTATHDFQEAANVRLAELRRTIVRSFDAMTFLRQQTELNTAPDGVAFQQLAVNPLHDDPGLRDVVFATTQADIPGLTVRAAATPEDHALLGRNIATDPEYAACLGNGRPAALDHLCLLPKGHGSFDLVTILPVTPRAAGSSAAGSPVTAVIAGRRQIDHLADADDPISVEVVDLAAPGVGLLHPHGAPPATVAAATRAGAVTIEQRLGVNTWRFIALPVAPRDQTDSWQSLLVLTGCLVLTVTLAGYVRADGLVRDRTRELEAVLDDLRESEQRLRDYVNTASDWYWETDADFHFTRVAAQAEEHGVDPATLAGLHKLTEGDAAEAVSQRLAVLQQHKPFRDLHYDYPRERSLSTIALSGMPMFGDDGRFLGYRGSARDVTVQMQAEAAQRSALWAAEQANRAKSTFLATMSHEIRTPMNGVLGMAQVLRQTALDQEQRRMCDLIFQSGNALQQILDDILDYSKLEAGKIAVESVSTWVPAIVRDVVSLMRGTAEAKGLAIDVQQSTTHLAPVMTDPTRLRQILFNLLSNAIKFSDCGVVTVTLSAVPAGPGKLDVTLSVADQGIGMSLDVQRRLFARFTQADTTTTRRFGGTGLGLAITRELVTLLGGNITVASAPDQGATFTMRLKLPVAESAEAPSPQFADTSGAADAGRSIRILLAEDDKINQMVMLGLLRDHSVTIAHNGAEAIRTAADGRFDLILMDIMMPDLDGLAATAAIRALPPPFGAVPIIALTANAMSGDRERYLAAGMDDYLSKPVERESMFTVMERVLGATLLRPRPGEFAPAELTAGEFVPAEPGAAATQDIDDFIGSLGRA